MPIRPLESSPSSVRLSDSCRKDTGGADKTAPPVVTRLKYMYHIKEEVMDVRIWFFGGPNDGEFVGVAQDLTTLKNLLLRFRPCIFLRAADTRSR